jgi:uncharacterized membrane protein
MFIVAALFAVLVAAESTADDSRPQLIQTGLLKWLVTGNWPAKVGAGLLILGVGALLRYALLHIEVPPSLKLGSGLLISALLATGAFALRERRERHAIHIALAGAGAGVAYLTAYSAYGFFGYVTEFNALAMLALIAVATGVFAVNANSMSIGILAMVGAYIAPAFALESAGPGPVYGYYLAISALCLVMVAMKGWRGLIHLSFLFTLAGGLFFGWTAKFAQPHYYGMMQPLLLALVAVHLAMPLVERRHLPSRWLSRFDVGYFVLLPVVAAALTLLIAPELREQGALGLVLLAVIWGFAAGVLKVIGRDEALRHAVVSFLFLTAAILCRLDDVPWLLLGLGFGVSALAIAPRMGWQKSTEGLLCGWILLFGLLHASGSLLEPAPAVAFANELFGKRLIAVVMLAIAGFIAHRRELSMAKMIITVAVGWLLLATTDELRRLYFDFIPQLIYGLLLGLIALTALTQRWIKVSSAMSGLLVSILILCGWWAVQDAGRAFALMSLVLTPLVLLGLSLGRSHAQGDDDGGAGFALAVLPLAMLPWAYEVFFAPGTKPVFMTAIFAILGAAASWLAARKWQREHANLHDTVLPTHFWFIAISLIWVTLAHIERSGPALAFEIIGLAYLVLFSASRGRAGVRRSTSFGTATVIAAALVMQAMLLRVLGPDRVMTIADLLKMSLPAVVSLMWASLGGGLAWWGTKRTSRSIWAAGAALLVASAIKLVLFDFGSLGQLANILALIAAGLVFLGVAWLAPVPPKRDPPVDEGTPPLPMNGPRSIPPRSPAPSPMQSPSAAAVSSPIQDSVAPVVPKAKIVDGGTGHSPNRAVFPAPPPLPESGSTGRINQEAHVNPAPMRRPVAAASRQAADTSGAWKMFFIFILMFFALIYALWQYTQMESARSSGRQDAYGASPARSEAGAEARADAARAMAAEEAASRAADIAEQQPKRATPENQAATENREIPENHATLIAEPSMYSQALTGDVCTDFTQSMNLPERFTVLATGAYSGRPSGLRIAQANRQAGQIDVHLSYAKGPVVLMLGAYEPTIWNVSWAPGTKVLGVLVGGYHVQQVVGLPSTTPVLVTSYEGKGPCGYFYVSSEGLQTLNPVAMRIFGRGVNSFYPANDGHAIVGDAAPLGSGSSELSIMSREGKDGLDDLIQLGLLKKATSNDSRLWTDVVRMQTGAPGPRSPAEAERHYSVPDNVFIVQGEFVYPPRLTGANPVIFVVPKGVPTPQGNPGHSSVYNFNKPRASR